MGRDEKEVLVPMADVEELKERLGAVPVLLAERPGLGKSPDTIARKKAKEIRELISTGALGALSGIFLSRIDTREELEKLATFTEKLKEVVGFELPVSVDGTVVGRVKCIVTRKGKAKCEFEEDEDAVEKLGDAGEEVVDRLEEAAEKAKVKSIQGNTAEIQIGDALVRVTVEMRGMMPVVTNVQVVRGELGQVGGKTATLGAQQINKQAKMAELKKAAEELERMVSWRFDLDRLVKKMKRVRKRLLKRLPTLRALMERIEEEVVRPSREEEKEKEEEEEEGREKEYRMGIKPMPKLAPKPVDMLKMGLRPKKEEKERKESGGKRAIESDVELLRKWHLAFQYCRMIHGEDMRRVIQCARKLVREKSLEEIDRMYFGESIRRLRERTMGVRPPMEVGSAAAASTAPVPRVPPFGWLIRRGGVSVA